MNALFQYILEMLASSGIFFAIYRLLIKKVRRFRWLRMYIISATLVSALLPFIEIPVYHTAMPPLSEADGGIEMEFANIQYDTNGILNDVFPASGYRWLILGLYLSVVAIRTGSVAVRLNSIKIKQILRKSGNFRVSYEKTGPDLLSVEKILPPELDGSNGSNRPKIIDGSEIADMIAAIVGESHDTFISVQYERNVSYGLYHHVIAQIDKAYNEARNRFALEKFGKGIGDLYDAELEAVKTEIPKRVVEIVPKDVELDIKM